MTRIALGISLAVTAALWWALVEAVRKGRALQAELNIAQEGQDQQWRHESW